MASTISIKLVLSSDAALLPLRPPFVRQVGAAAPLGVSSTTVTVRVPMDPVPGWVPDDRPDPALGDRVRGVTDTIKGLASPTTFVLLVVAEFIILPGSEVVTVGVASRPDTVATLSPIGDPDMGNRVGRFAVTARVRVVVPGHGIFDALQCTGSWS